MHFVVREFYQQTLLKIFEGPEASNRRFLLWGLGGVG
jgi:hypothetical protein